MGFLDCPDDCPDYQGNRAPWVQLISEPNNNGDVYFPLIRQGVNYDYTWSNGVKTGLVVRVLGGGGAVNWWWVSGRLTISSNSLSRVRLWRKLQVWTDPYITEDEVGCVGMGGKPPSGIGGGLGRPKPTSLAELQAGM